MLEALYFSRIIKIFLYKSVKAQLFLYEIKGQIIYCHDLS